MKQEKVRIENWAWNFLDEAVYQARLLMEARLSALDRALASEVTPAEELVRSEFLRICTMFGVNPDKAVRIFEKIRVYA